MGLLWIAAAAAASKKLNSRYGRPKSSSNGEKSNQSTGYSYDVHHSYIDCVMAELECESGEDLNNFFKKILEEFQNCIGVDIQEKNTELKEKRNELIEFKAKYGIEHSDYDRYLQPTYIFDELTKSFDGDSCVEEILYDIKYVHGNYAKFGERLGEKKLSLESDIGRNLAKLPEMEQNIKEFKRKKIFFPLDREYWEDKLYKEMYNYKKVQEKLEQDKVTLKAYSYYYRLYNEKSELLKKCFDNYAKYLSINSEREKIEQVIHNYKRISSGEDTYEKNYRGQKLVQAFENLIQSGQITENELQKVFLLLDKVEIKGRRGEYEFLGYRDHSTKLKKSIVEWFISNVYELDENFVDRNYNLPEEENHLKLS